METTHPTQRTDPSGRCTLARSTVRTLPVARAWTASERPRWKSEPSAQVVAGAGRQNAERHGSGGARVDAQVRHAVAAHHQQLVGLGDRTPAGVLRFGEAACLHHPEVRVGQHGAQLLDDPGQHPPGAAPSGGGVDHQVSAGRRCGHGLSTRSAASRFAFLLSWIRQISSAIRNSAVIGRASASIENGSVEGVAAAPNTKVPKIT